MPITINGDGNISGFNKIDAPTFVVDETNNRVGIGTDTPSESLDVNGRIFTRAQNGGITWGGDVDTAKWSSKLGGYSLTFGNDGTSGTALETWSVGGRTYRGYVRFTNSGAIIANNQPAIFLDGNNTNFVTTALGAAINNYNVTAVRGGVSYNDTNGRITVPLSGLYALNFQVYQGQNTTARIWFRRNGLNVYLFHFGSVPADRTSNGSAIIYANANDYFELANDGGGSQLFSYRGGSGHHTLSCQFLG
jgi:hypothetical protein